MKEKGRKHTIQKEKDNAIMNFVSRQAQEAILDPNLPESYKDSALESALDAILKIVERKNAYNARSNESRHPRDFQIPRENAEK